MTKEAALCASDSLSALIGLNGLVNHKSHTLWPCGTFHVFLLLQQAYQEHLW